MADTAIEIKVEELYALVWSTTVVGLAESLGITDAGVKKRLTKAGVVPPPLGYEQKRRGNYASDDFPRLPKIELNRVVSFKVPELFNLDEHRQRPEFVQTLDQLRNPPKFQDVTREELYGLVSRAPLQDVAGLIRRSPGEITGICSRHDIPMPTGNDWKNLKLSKPVALLPLPPGRNVVVTTVPAEVKLDELLQGASPFSNYRPAFPQVKIGPALEEIIDDWQTKSRITRHFATPAGVIEGLRREGLQLSDRSKILAFFKQLPASPASTLRRELRRSGLSAADVGIVLSSLRAIAEFYEDPVKLSQPTQNLRQTRTAFAAVPQPKPDGPVIESPTATAPANVEEPVRHPGIPDSVALRAETEHQNARELLRHHPSFNQHDDGDENDVLIRGRATAFFDWLSRIAESGNWAHRRDLAIIQLMRHLGLSLTETLSIRRDDVDLLRATARYVGRAGSMRSVDLDDRTVLAITRYGRGMPRTTSAMLFVGKNGEALTEQTARRALADHFDRAGIEPFPLRTFWLPQRRQLDIADA